MNLQYLIGIAEFTFVYSSVVANHRWADYRFATTTGVENLTVIDSTTSVCHGSFEE